MKEYPKTLNSYIEKLKPHQQDYLTLCVAHWGDEKRKAFHRGLLPFLDVFEATHCLQLQLDSVIEANTDTRVATEGYIRRIMSVFARAATRYRLYENEVSAIVCLNTRSLKLRVGNRMSGKFIIRADKLNGYPYNNGHLVEFQMVSRNMWRVTTNPDTWSDLTYLFDVLS